MSDKNERLELFMTNFMVFLFIAIVGGIGIFAAYKSNQ